MENKIIIFWFRRDLRLEDNVGLQKALASGYPVLPLFIFDTDILSRLDSTYDRRVDYIHHSLQAINSQLHVSGSTLHTFRGSPKDIFEKLIQTHQVQAVYCNRDYEPYANERDIAVAQLLNKKGIAFSDFKDQVIFDRAEVIKSNGEPYTVFTPYAKKWRENLNATSLTPMNGDVNNFWKETATDIISLESMGFEKTDLKFEAPALPLDIIKNYGLNRNFPAMDHTTHLGIALRFGTISIRHCVSIALKYNDTWLSELIWREFFMQILYHFPRVVNNSFKPQYDHIQWRNNESEFNLWCEGKTGYPIVDAGMRQLNQTGFMHNRVRMVTASFLCKHLLIDWRWGEAYFAAKLNDYDLSANNGNWQWAASTGCDAAPYFRIFNPTIQTTKFDKDLKYIRRWNPDFEHNPIEPIVIHEVARKRALEIYKRGLDSERARMT